MRRTTGVLVAVAIAVAAAGCGDEKKGREMDAALRALVGRTARPAFVTADAEGTRLWKQTRDFYAKREYAPAWIEDAKPRPQMEALTTALGHAEREGLDPELYNVSTLEARRAEADKGFLSQKGFDPKEAGALDAWLTYLYMKYASDLADGLSDLATADPTWKIAPEKFNPLAHLEAALAANRIEDSLTELTPRAPAYVGLRSALAEHREMAKNGGWPGVPKNVKLKAGQKSPAVAAVARRLAASGDYDGRVPDEKAGALPYDKPLQEAVARFQRRHGLSDDGAIGPEVVSALNLPLAQRIRQIEMNMERWRWLPRDLGERHILVNIPEMRLNVHDGGDIPLTMRVVVGKRDTQTPIFNDEMSYLVFSPYWNVPDSIAQGETLPAMMSDPAFLDRNNMEVVDKAGQAVDPASMDMSDLSKYRFRQRPGSSNSLGLVKFMFPNQFNVYLHDTPADSLFTRANRAFSHGCVRLEDPVALASYVLGDQPEWTKERIEAAMHAGEEKTVKLKAALPVYLGYWTASVSPDGQVQFRQDVYGIDGQLRSRLVDRIKRLRQAGKVASQATAVGGAGQ